MYPCSCKQLTAMTGQQPKYPVAWPIFRYPATNISKYCVAGCSWM